MKILENCWNCLGMGRFEYNDVICPECHGTGLLEREETTEEIKEREHLISLICSPEAQKEGM